MLANLPRYRTIVRIMFQKGIQFPHSLTWEGWDSLDRGGTRDLASSSRFSPSTNRPTNNPNSNLEIFEKATTNQRLTKTAFGNLEILTNYQTTED